MKRCSIAFVVAHRTIYKTEIISSRRAADILPDFGSFLSADAKKKTTTNITSQLYFFHRPTVLRFWSPVWHRPIVGRLLMKNKPLKLGRLSGDHPVTFLSADHLQTVVRLNRLSAVDRQMIGRWLALISHAQIFFIAFI